jgi:hypothetical protein
VGGSTGASARFTAFTFVPAAAPVTQIEGLKPRRVRFAEMLSKVAPGRAQARERLS